MRARLLGTIAVLGMLMTIARAGDSGRQIIVKLKEGHTIRDINEEHGTKTVRGVSKRGLYLIETDGQDERTLKKLKRNRGVEGAEFNRKIRLNSARLANFSPTLVQDMMAMLDGGTTTNFNGSTVLKAYVEQPALRLVGVNDVRQISTGAGTRIAYIDTGVDPTHPALRPWLEPGADLLFNRSSSELDGLSQDMMAMLDQDMMAMLDKRLIFLLNQSLFSILNSSGSQFPPAFGHGTLVAGLIHVVAPDARIAPIKAFDAYGYTDLFTLIEAVYKAVDLDADVLNMSFSTTEDSELFRKAIDTARGHGMAIVASAGNDGRDGKNVYPAAYSAVHGIAATDLYDRLAPFSNYGSAVSAAAPGAYVISTVPGGRYAVAWGTSFSAPIVGGAMALLASSRGYGHSNSALVINTADSIDALNPGYERKLGRGRINLRQALKPR